MSEGNTRRFYSCSLAALATLVPGGKASPVFAFLRNHAPARRSFEEVLELCLCDPAPADRPLLDLATTLRMTRIELLSVALAVTVETDMMCGRAVAELQAPVGGSRPTLGLLAAAFAGLQQDRSVTDILLTGTAMQSGLLTLVNDNAPLAERPVAVPVPLCMALDGRDAAWPGTSAGLGDAPSTQLAPSTLAHARKQARVLSTGPERTLVIRSMAVSEGRAAAHEIANILERRALFIETERAGPPARPAPALQGLVPLLLLRQLIPVFCFELGPGDRRTVPSLPGYDGPVLALCGLEGSIEANNETPTSWKIEVPPREERHQLWQAAIGPGELSRRLASDYRHGASRIAQLGRLARRECLLQGRREIDFAAIASASWAGEGSALESLAQPLRDAIPDEALVVSSGLSEELSRLLLRCRLREGLVDGLGASATARYHPGVRALFTGPSGTGKTLAAGWLATRLGLPLFRADLAAVTSKYIGETEKNLAQLLSRAEESAIILLFDEADSLFGKRTDVKESNDRFANAQTNYLLQRIESFDGIALLTSNSRARFDPAFCRRLDMIVEFPLPGPEERRSLWISHLGAHHKLTPKELNLIAASADLAGGHIRNAVLTASALARTADRSIQFDDLLVGLADEYRKLGQRIPAALAGGA
jgi:hypothetical protein